MSRYDSRSRSGSAAAAGRFGNSNSRWDPVCRFHQHHNSGVSSDSEVDLEKFTEKFTFGRASAEDRDGSMQSPFALQRLRQSSGKAAAAGAEVRNVAAGAEQRRDDSRSKRRTTMAQTGRELRRPGPLLGVRSRKERGAAGARRSERQANCHDNDAEQDRSRSARTARQHCDIEDQQKEHKISSSASSSSCSDRYEYENGYLVVPRGSASSHVGSLGPVNGGFRTRTGLGELLVGAPLRAARGERTMGDGGVSRGSRRGENGSKEQKRTSYAAEESRSPLYYEEKLYYAKAKAKTNPNESAPPEDNTGHVSQGEEEFISSGLDHVVKAAKSEEEEDEGSQAARDARAAAVAGAAASAAVADEKVVSNLRCQSLMDLFEKVRAKYNVDFLEKGWLRNGGPSGRVFSGPCSRPEEKQVGPRAARRSTAGAAARAYGSAEARAFAKHRKQ
eukprot:g2823.t1